MTKMQTASSRRWCSTQVPVALSWDLETTGLDRCSEIVQIAVVDVSTVNNQQRQEAQAFARYVMPHGSIDWRAEQAHSISLRFLEQRNAKSFEVVLAELILWLERFGDRPLVWAAHNGDQFDVPVLTNAISRTGSDWELPGRHVDTLKLARAALAKPARQAGSHTLGTLYAEATGETLGDSAHDALADAIAVARVWKWLVCERGADHRVPAETLCFESHLALVASQGPPVKPWQRRSSGSSSKKKPAAKDLPAGSLLAIAGLGEGTEAKLHQVGITTVSDLREAIARDSGTANFVPSFWGLPAQEASQRSSVMWVGGEDEGARKACIGGCKRWLKQATGLRLHPGSRHKIAEWLCSDCETRA